MYAVIENGGKQYRVELGAELELDQLTADPGARIDIGRVLLVADGDERLIGRPVVDGARVTAEVVRATRGDKLIVFKYRPKARRRVKHGHRQDLTLVRIADIEFSGRSAATEAKAAKDEEQRARAEAAQAAEAKAKADAALAAKLAADKQPKAETEAKAKTEPKARATKAEAKPTAAKSAGKSVAKPKAEQADKKSSTAKPAAAAPKKKKEE
jgi:large subunit ribosomal protein L21